ncbi:hypothetical protein Tco_1196772 [Tanacetum coccineum]
MSTSATHNAIMETGGKDSAPMLIVGSYMMDHPAKEATEIHPTQPARRGLETYSSVSPEKRQLIDTEAKAVHIILTGIDNDIYSIVESCDNAKEMWLAIERLMQGKNTNKQDVETKFFWAFGKFTSQDGESLEFYYFRFHKLMNELVRNKCETGQYENQRVVNVAGNMDTVVAEEATGPVFDKESLEHVHDNDEYNVFAMEKVHPEQPESINDTYMVERGDSNTTHDSSYMSNIEREVD